MSARKAKETPRPVRARTRTGRRRAASQIATGTRLTPEERWRKIAEAAYQRAEKRGFAPGGELDDWLAAEEEIDHEFGGG